jgi:hypothetical protein
MLATTKGSRARKVWHRQGDRSGGRNRKMLSVTQVLI